MWWDRLRAPGRPAETELAFFAWLQASPDHADAYLRVAATATAPKLREEPQPDTDVPPLRRFSLVAAAGFALVLGILMVSVWLRSTATREVRWVAPHGARPVHVLEDGSEVTLASEAEVTVRYSPEERLIRLDRGRAFFHVAKGDGRRFRVLAGDASVVATGTKFDVRIEDHGERVSLIEGRIIVYADSLALEEEGSHETSAVRSLNAGEQVQVSQGQVSRPVDIDQAVVSAWQHGQLIARDMTLAEVVEEYNLYAAHPIRVVDPALARMRIGGVFNVSDSETFLAFLQATLGVEIRATGSTVELRRANSARVRAGSPAL